MKPSFVGRLASCVWCVFLLPLGDSVRAAPPTSIVIDGDLSDWAAIPGVADPSGDISKPGTDILEFKFAHDESHFYVYSRHAGPIVSEDAGTGGQGRYYYLVFIDLDDNINTGFVPGDVDPDCYSAISQVGTDIELQFERDWNDGMAAYDVQYMYGSGGYDTYATASPEILAGTMRIAPGDYGEKVSFKFLGYDIPSDVTLTNDISKSGYTPGLDIFMTQAFSGNMTESELSVDFTACLVDETGTPNVQLGQTISIGFACESSPWDPCGDGVTPIEGYVLEDFPTPTPTSTSTPTPTSTQTPSSTPTPTPDSFEEVWVDFAYQGTETGDQTQPFNTLAEAVTVVTTGGTLKIKPGSSSETPRISKAMRIEAPSGAVRIGDPGGKVLPSFNPDPNRQLNDRINAVDLVRLLGALPENKEKMQSLFEFSAIWMREIPQQDYSN